MNWILKTTTMMIEEEEIDEECNVIYEAPGRRGGQGRIITSQNESLMVWQEAGQGTVERHSATTTDDHQDDVERNMAGASNEKRSSRFFDTVISYFGKVFPTESSSPSTLPPSSDESILSDNANDNKSLSSKYSLPSYSSEQTRKVNNLSPKVHTIDNNNNMASIAEGDDNQRGFRWLVSTRKGLIILTLLIILVIALIVTIAAATTGGRQHNQPSSSQSNDDGVLFPDNTQAPTVPEVPLRPSLNIPTMSPMAESASTPASTTVPSNSITSPPTESSVSFTSSPTVATPQPTPRPTPEPTLAPTASPTMQPTTGVFSDWVWTQKGLSFQGDEAGERYGQTVAISEDGKTMAIGSPYATVNGRSQAGMVEIYTWDDVDRRGWISYGLLEGRNAGNQFGSALALSDDGSVLAVSEPTYNGRAGSRSGSVRVFVHDPFSGYSPLGQDLEGEDATDHFGIGLALSSNGKRLAVGAPYHDNSDSSGNNGNGNGNGNGNRKVSGHTKVFQFSVQKNSWVLVGATPIEGVSHLDWFGWSVDLNEDGSLVCVGAPRNLEYGGYVQCFEEENPDNPNTEWVLVGETIQNSPTPIRYDDNFGTAVRVSSSGKRHRVAIGSPGKNKDELDAGLVIVYEFNTKAWSQLGQALLSPAPFQNNNFGESIDIKGDLLAVGVPGAGEVNLFRYQSDTKEWERHPRTFQGQDGSNFGMAVRINSFGDLVVGSPSVGTVNLYTVDASG